MLQRGWEEGLRQLIAGKIALLMSSLVGIHEQPQPSPHPKGPRPSRDPWLQAASAAYLVLEARRGSIRMSDVIASVAWWSSWVMPSSLLVEASRRPFRPLNSERRGFIGLVTACVEYAKMPSIERLERMASTVARELMRPCSKDPRLETERSRLESSMKKLGLILGLTLPALFIASLAYNPLLALGSVAVAAAIWGIVRRIGVKFRELNIETSWSACSMKPNDVIAAILGRDMPTLLDLLGVTDRKDKIKGFNR